ncbi:hypothetical protein AAES_04291 [Amazona aestiva]|uniref:Retroviral nucleocapsid Gag protein p24 C-terminal domain-containing protein n=1 Tax=Amazona aestiva TaxID=12930 RepID=A0A0Q3X911_AMAAE|nr:hypothetical protein AAES_04291 [Amazona aestiva]
MLQVPDVGKSVKAFTGIKQAEDEPYMQFIDRLETAIDKQVENDVAKEALLLKLAIENANLDCQKVLRNTAKLWSELSGIEHQSGRAEKDQYRDNEVFPKDTCRTIQLQSS